MPSVFLAHDVFYSLNKDSFEIQAQSVDKKSLRMYTGNRG